MKKTIVRGHRRGRSHVKPYIKRIPYGKEIEKKKTFFGLGPIKQSWEYEGMGNRCPDCGVKKGQLHKKGCDLERTSSGKQYISSKNFGSSSKNFGMGYFENQDERARILNKREKMARTEDIEFDLLDKSQDPLTRDKAIALADKRSGYNEALEDLGLLHKTNLEERYGKPEKKNFRSSPRSFEEWSKTSEGQKEFRRVLREAGEYDYGPYPKKEKSISELNKQYEQTHRPIRVKKGKLVGYRGEFE